eukprot:m.475323 g.475323  ORF g.475323 m.475323 type:complete len:89 (-) comp20395_c0_seq15:1095-1361(-)
MACQCGVASTGEIFFVCFCLPNGEPYQVLIRQRAGHSCPSLWSGGFAFLTDREVAVVGLSSLYTCAVDLWVHGPHAEASAAMRQILLP